MAISVSSVTSGSSTTNATTYATASITPTTGRVLVVVTQMSGIGTDVASTVAGLSGTWNSITRFWSSSTAFSINAFWCTNYTGTGTLTLGNTDSATHCIWSVFLVDGAEISAPIVAGSPVSGISSGSVGSFSLTLPSPADSNNRPFSGWSYNANTANIALPRTNWTEIHDNVVSTPSGTLETQWRSDAHETTASISLDLGTTATIQGLAWEMAILPVAGQAPAGVAGVTATAGSSTTKLSTEAGLAAVTAATNSSGKVAASSGVSAAATAAFDATVQTGTGDDPTAEPNESVVGVAANDATTSIFVPAACP